MSAEYKRTQREISRIWEIANGKVNIVSDAVVERAELLADQAEDEEEAEIVEALSEGAEDGLERVEPDLPELYHRLETLTTGNVHYTRVRGVGRVIMHPDYGLVISAARRGDPDEADADNLSFVDLLPIGVEGQTVIFDVTMEIGLLTSGEKPIPLWDQNAEVPVPPSPEGLRQD